MEWVRNDLKTIWDQLAIPNQYSQTVRILIGFWVIKYSLETFIIVTYITTVLYDYPVCLPNVFPSDTLS